MRNKRMRASVDSAATLEISTESAHGGATPADSVADRQPTRPRPRWVEVKSTGQPAIIVRERRGAVHIRIATHDGHYHWTDWNDLIRRPDLDASPDPAWLAQARVSPRPNPILWPLIGLVPMTVDDDSDRFIADDRDPSRRAPMFETDAAGRVLDDEGDTDG